jgi:radical SAM superfamily enzyme YgiQ (UPF0313 family)
LKVALVNISRAVNVSRGAGYVAGALIRAGHELGFFDTSHQPLNQVAQNLARGQFEALLVSTMSMDLPDAVELVRQVKRSCELPVLVGGVHPTIVGGRVLEDHPEIDYLCVGEGESMVIEFLEKLGSDALRDVPNLAYRHQGRVVVNPLRPPEDLAQSPEFPWHLFPREAVVQQPWGFLYVNATRGCPYNCTYCCNGVYLKHYGKSYFRFRAVADIVEELIFLKRDYSPRLFYFGDEMILSDRAYAVRLFEDLRRKVKTPYGCMVRVEHLDAETVKIMARTGCRYVGLGLECGNEEFRRKHLSRHMSNAQIEEAVTLLKKAGIFVTTFNMIGFPFDNDDFLTEETIRFNQKLRPDFLQVSVFYPLPGTRLHARCTELDLIDPEKMARIRGYGEDSVLKGVSIGEKREEMEALFSSSSSGPAPGESRWRSTLRRACPRPLLKLLRALRGG